MVGERVGVVDAGVLPGYTFVGMDIKTPKAGNEFVGRTLDNGRSVIVYATGTITDSSPQTWYGDLYAPWGLVSYTGAARSRSTDTFRRGSSRGQAAEQTTRALARSKAEVDRRRATSSTSLWTTT